METLDLRILLVDDDHIFSDVIMGKLRSRGLSDVTRAESAEQALDLIEGQSQPFDVYLLDIMLGEMDGIELCRRLRQHVACKSVPIIMITASQQSPLMERAFQAGATDFMRKPLNDTELAGRIGTAMLLVEATKKEKRMSDASLTGVVSVPRLDTLCADEHVCFSDVSGMMDYYKLENKLHRLQDGSYQLSIFRICIIDFQEHCTRADREASLKCLHVISERISNTIPGTQLLLSYIGQGHFLCCIIGRTSRKFEPLHNRLQYSACQAVKGAAALGGKKIDIAVSPLADRNILTKAEAINLVRREIDQISDLATATLPEVHAVVDNIFDKVEGAPSFA